MIVFCLPWPYSAKEKLLKGVALLKIDDFHCGTKLMKRFQIMHVEKGRFMKRESVTNLNILQKESSIRVLKKKVLLKKSQNSQENTCAGVSF